MKHTKSHMNQTNEDQTQRANIKSSKGKATNNTQGIPMRITADLSIETPQARSKWQDLLKVMKEKNLLFRLGSPSNVKEKSKQSQTSKS